MKLPVYHTDPYQTQCMATVTEVLEMDGQYHIQLDAQLFYPEGGGQPSDSGTIDSIPIRAIYENESGIYHVLDVLPHTDRPVPCLLDWTLRFDHMQQHSGQHLLSAVMSHLYDAATVGFRLTEDHVTIDLDKRLTAAEIDQAELDANRLIWSGKAIKAYWPEAEALSTLPLRKQPQVEEAIRVIEISEYDYSPCCGTHVAHTSEIGLIKVSRYENYKAGVRLEFRCGRRALAQYSQYTHIIQQMGRTLSATPDGLEAAFERLCAELVQTKENNDMLTLQLQAYQAKALLSEAEKLGDVRLVVGVQELDAKALKSLATLMTQQPATIALLGTMAEGKAQILLQRSQDLNALDMKALFSAVAPMINGRGGGNAAAAQGGGDMPDALPACLEQARLRLTKQLMQTQ